MPEVSQLFWSGKALLPSSLQRRTRSPEQKRVPGVQNWQAPTPVPLPVHWPVVPADVVQVPPPVSGIGKHVALPPCGMHTTAAAHTTFWLQVKLTHGFSGTQVPAEHVPDWPLALQAEPFAALP